jgi:hypothetical protein
MLAARLAFVAAAIVLLANCAGSDGFYNQGVEKGEPNLAPQNYRPDIVAYLRAYLNDPSGVRDAMIAAPELKSIRGTQRYVVCVRFNAKKTSGGYEGSKERMVVFLAGRLDTMVEARKDDCAGAKYEPFPELEKLSR